MAVSTETGIDTDRALQGWVEYQQRNDVFYRKGQTAGIDPDSGRVWFGKSIVDIVNQMDVEGVFAPLYYARIGYDHYYHKRACLGTTRRCDFAGRHRPAAAMQR